MSKKNLLSESTIRKFMKFANIDALTDNFLQEGTYMEEGEYMEEMEDHSMEEGHGMAHGDKPMEEMAHSMEEGEHEDKADDAEEKADDAMDMADDAELPAEAVAALEQAVEAAVDSLLDALRPYGVEGDVEVEADAEMEMPGDEGPEDAAADAMDDMDAAMDDMDKADDEAEDALDMLDEEAIVNETLARVTKRLQEMKATKQADTDREALAERIAEAISRRLRK